MYFDQLGSEKEEIATTEVQKETRELEVYQCQDCFTVYNEAYGDITQNIPKNTRFENLPKNYKCSLCEAPKTSFKKVMLLKKV